MARWCSHNFWVLRGPHGQWLGELHGLATDRRHGRPVPIGYARWHALQAWHFTPAQGLFLCRPGQPHHLVWCGDEAAVRERWAAALACVEPINRQNLTYPRGGIRLWGPTCNSNSVFSTFALAMGLAPPRFAGLWQPGLSQPIAL
ncbi:hypothetical protein [Pseudomonas sp. RIT-PI-S]|uniref:hypothetical protein n=1 Tax=Pseudomonas sp. RIT-PI-S TaxID=3035295 RepID=UPI0021D7FA78|nr:hypothetical protein [Pseudomonas sp. RIT-PI-S]